jgi:predicted amidohydrolase YtcJ
LSASGWRATFVIFPTFSDDGNCYYDNNVNPNEINNDNDINDLKENGMSITNNTDPDVQHREGVLRCEGMHCCTLNRNE